MSSLEVERSIKHKIKTNKENKYTKIKTRLKNKKDMTQKELYNIYTLEKKRSIQLCKKKTKMRKREKKERNF